MSDQPGDPLREQPPSPIDETPLYQVLEQRARTLTESRMTPKSGPLSEDKLKEIRETLREYQHRNKLSDTRVSHQVGVSTADIRHFVSGAYDGKTDISSLARRINNWMQTDAEQRISNQELHYVNMAVMTRITSVLSEAIRSRSMVMIVGPAGSSKTISAKATCHETNGAYVQVDELSSPRDLLVEICKAAKFEVSTRDTAARLRSQLIAQLLPTAGRRPLAIDDIDGMPDQCISLLRSIHDRTETPILMFGTRKFLERINDRADGRGQLASRILIHDVTDHVLEVNNPNGPSGSKAYRYCKLTEIVEFLRAQKMRFSDEGAQWMHAFSCLQQWGMLRSIARLCQLARDADVTYLTPTEIHRFMRMRWTRPIADDINEQIKGVHKVLGYPAIKTESKPATPLKIASA